MIRLPSYQRAYDLVWSGDPALKQPPVDPGRQATDEQLAEYKAACEDYDAILCAAQETGNWAALLLENQVPLKFVVDQVDRNVWRQVIDRGALPSSNPRWIGPGAVGALLLRLALVDVVGAEMKIERRPDPNWDGWVMAQPEIINVLDQVNTSIVAELGGAIYRRLMGLKKK